MNEHPILFSGAMVRAILSGAKTQTRRVVKRTGWNEHIARVEEWRRFAGDWLGVDMLTTPHAGRFGVPCLPPFPCPYGAPGDRLWVRETFAFVPGVGTCYRATVSDFDDMKRQDAGVSWRPSIFMRRADSRLTLAVESVRVERLRDISEDDARAEGVEPLFGNYVAGFAALWTQINGTRPGADWNDCNPWVWVVTFRRVIP